MADVLAQVWSVRSKAFLVTGKELGWGERTIKQLSQVWGAPIAVMAKSLWPNQDPRLFEEEYHKNKKRFPIKEVEGAGETIRKLIKTGYIVGILTSINSQMLQTNLEQIGMADIDFKVLQSSDDTKVYKPDGRVFEPALKKSQRLGVNKNEVLYIGDDIRDWLACQDAGLSFVAVLTGRSTKKQFLKEGVLKEKILDSIADLPTWLEKKG